MIFQMGSDATQLIDLRRTRTCRHDRLSDCHWPCACSEYSAMDNNQLLGAANDSDQMHLALGSLRATILTLGKYTSYPQARWIRGWYQQNPQSQQENSLFLLCPPPPEIIKKYLLRSKHNLSHKTIQFRDAMAICERLGPAVHMEGTPPLLEEWLVTGNKKCITTIRIGFQRSVLQAVTSQTWPMIQGDLASASLSSAQDADLFSAFTTRESKKICHWFQSVQDQGEHFLVSLRHPKPQLPLLRAGMGVVVWVLYFLFFFK